MKTSDHEQKLRFDGTEKPGFQKILARHGDFRKPGAGPRQRGDLDDDDFYGVAKDSGTEPAQKSAGKSRYRHLADL